MICGHKLAQIRGREFDMVILSPNFINLATTQRINSGLSRRKQGEGEPSYQQINQRISSFCQFFDGKKAGHKWTQIKGSPFNGGGPFCLKIPGGKFYVRSKSV